ncbi:MAG: sigma-54 dependent transcriptional regulator [Planctomycetota bacterium]
MSASAARDEDPRGREALAALIGRSAAMEEVRRRARLAARSEVPTLVSGETGTGKELVARILHAGGPRRDGPFVAVNCAAIPEGLIEAELFGHAKGAFTGATQERSGLLEAARGGTLFLDEVGDLPPFVQVKLLRVLQEREFRRVGEDALVAADFRLVTATHRDLRRRLEQELLRPDFFYRIRVFEIRIPPLRERREDLPELLRHFTAATAARLDVDPPGYEDAALDALHRHDWPGNVRELENAVEHAFVTLEGPTIREGDLPDDVRIAEEDEDRSLADEAAEREAVLAALRAVDWNRVEAARRLGISRVTLWKRMRRLGIDELVYRTK